MLSDNLKALRKIHKYTQEQLAEKLGISRQAIAKWESGETIPDINNCMKLARLYDVTLDDLVNYNEEKEGLIIPPKGKYMLGTVILDENLNVPLPPKAATLFEFAPGDELLVLGDEGEGIALVKKSVFLRKVDQFFDEMKQL